MEKADIVKVGSFMMSEGQKIPTGWTFNCKGTIPMLLIDMSKGEPVLMFAGYKLEELERIVEGNEILNNINI